jgi:Helix-turn-helix domain
MRGSHCKSTTYDECALQCAQENLDQGQHESPRFINPHRLFHGVWMPQWLEERPEVSEKAKKLNAYLTYFAGGKGCSWPSFGLLAEKLHCSRRHVMRLVQELSTHRLITVTNVTNPARGHCANYYRFLWHPWMQNERDGSFVLEAPESEPLDASGASSGGPPSDIRVTSPLVTSPPPAPSDMSATSPGDRHVIPLVTSMSPKELKAEGLYDELTAHQAALGFTPDDPPPKPKPPRQEECSSSTAFSDWPSPEEVRKTFNELRRSLGWPIKR